MRIDMDKVYLVTATKGEYEDRITITVGVYDSQEKAEEGQIQYLADVKNFQNKYSEEEKVRLYKERDNGWKLDSSGKSQTEEVKDFQYWLSFEPYEYNEDVRIVEMVINQQHYKFE